MALKLLTTGVPGFDAVLGGGLPEYSFNLIAGAPGCGKTTLIHQLAFANASEERPAVYFTVVGEPPLKMLRYQQQMAFFDAEKAGTAIRFVDLSQEVLGGDLGPVLEKIIHYVETINPAIVVVDSFRTVLRARRDGATSSGELELQAFLQRLALLLTSWQTTSFLVGEYLEDEMRDNPVFTVADSIIWLSQHRERASVVRKLDVVKMRGVATMPGLHTFRISSEGVQIFPRVTSEGHDTRLRSFVVDPSHRAAFGVTGVDEMLGGGLPAGEATLIAGPSGTGKTLLTTHFIAEGVKRGEAGVVAIFEEQPSEYLLRAQQMGFDLIKMAEEGKIKLLYLRPLDLSAEEILYQIQLAVSEVGAQRLIIDSLNGVELALATSFREDFRESLYRLVNRLTNGGVSVLMTVEVAESFNEIKFSPHAISFLAQNIVFLRYVEVESQLRRMMAVIKMRRSEHSHDLREYEINAEGIRVLEPFREHEGILTGVAKQRSRSEPSRRLGLSEAEQQTLDVLLISERLTSEELSRKTGLSAQAVQAALGRLRALHYILESDESEQTFYSALERPVGGRSK
jgi:circadian clock protein KaiC